MKDFYYILGLDPSCSSDQIKEAYRKLSKKLHPDLNLGDKYFENRFRDVKEAFETLRDPAKRRLYDAKLNSSKSQSPGQQPQVPRQANQPYTQATRSAYTWSTAPKPGKIRKKGLGVGLSLTLVALALIIGIYLFRSFTGSVHNQQLLHADSVAVAQPVHKKHKHKHLSDNRVAANNDKKTFDTAKVVAVQPAITGPMTVKPEPIAPPARVKPEPLRPMIAKTWPDSDKTHSDYLYTTYVHPNVTGIVPMRAYNRFNASIIAAIPANAKVFVLERGSVYYRVFYDNSIGFVPKWSLHQK